MSIATALRNYRVAAWVTGVGLLVLTVAWVRAIWMSGEVFGHDDPFLGYVGMTHGFLYMAYIVCTLILAERCRWRIVDAVVILLAGTIPVASFVAERQVTRRVREGRAVIGS